MENIHLIKTDKPSRLFLNKINNKLLFLKNETRIDTASIGQYQHIYITSDEEIKDGDWMIRNNEQPIKVTPNFFWDFGVRYYKIILTTDQDLIADGIQAIDDKFLEWYVKNSSCERVEIEKTFVTNSGLGYQEYAVLDSKFKVIEIIPQTSYY